MPAAAWVLCEVNVGYRPLHSVWGDTAVFGGGIADIGFENAAEVGGGLKAEPRADLLNTQITVVKQHQHGKVNRFFVFVVNRSHAERLSEQAVKVRYAEVAHIGKKTYGDFVGRACGDILRRLFYALVKRRQCDGLKVACKHGAYVIKLCAVGEVCGAVGKILGNTAKIRTKLFKAVEYLNMKHSPAERVAERKNVKMTGIKDRFGRAYP